MSGGSKAPRGDTIPFDTGDMSVAEMRLVLDALDVDVTFVDAERRIRYYNENYRIFTRTPDIIGSDVVACHSAGSQGRVERLMSELETGWRDDAEFLEQVNGRLVHIRYVALRDDQGAYHGMVEIARYADEEPTASPEP